MQSLLLLLLLHFSCCLVLLLLLLLLLLVPPLDHLRNWIFQSDSHRCTSGVGNQLPVFFFLNFLSPFLRGIIGTLRFRFVASEAVSAPPFAIIITYVGGNRRYLQIDYLLLFSLFFAAILPQQPIVYVSPKNRGGTMHTTSCPEKKMPQKLELLLTRTSKEEGKK